MKFLFGGLLGRLLSFAVVAVIAAGAGWYFFIREDNEAQKSAADVTDEVRDAVSQTATPSPGGLTGKQRDTDCRSDRSCRN